MVRFYEKIKEYYRLGLWGDKRVHDAVKKRYVSAEEYKELTGKEYIEE